MIEIYLFNSIFAAAFAAIGYMIGRKLTESKYLGAEYVGTIVDATIDNLTKDGYIQTKGQGEDQELLKWYERNEDEN